MVKNRKKNAARPIRAFSQRELTVEQKLDTAIRCVYGESAAALGREVGVPASVVESWVERVGDILENKPEAAEGVDIQKDMDALKVQRDNLLKRIESRRRRLENLEVTRRMLLERPPFMV